MGITMTRRPFWVPKQREVAAPPAEPTQRSLVEQIKAGRKAKTDLCEHHVEGDRRDAEFARMKEEHTKYCEWHRNQTRFLQHAIEAGRKAESRLLAAVELPPETRRLDTLGKAHLEKSAELRVRTGINAARMAPPEETPEFKQLAQVNREITECQARIKRSKSLAGTSRDDFRLEKLLNERSQLQPEIDRYAKQYQDWREIQAEKQAAEDCFTKRDQLRQEARDAALAKALKSGK